MKIMVDAGHGGKDPGAVNGSNKESKFALQLALKLGKLLSDKGHCVHYTRTEDTYPSITERCKLANNLNVDLFISLHLNSATSKTANGIETLCYEAKGDCSTLAYSIQNNLIKVTGAKNRGVKIRPDLGVLRGTKMTAVLIEAGFISNDNELKLLASDYYQNKICSAIANCI